MTDQEFIELLNLYVDREISVQDAARLESAVTASPRRRSVYNQYCKMQKACSMLSDQYTEAGAESETDTVVFPQATGWRMGPLVMGLVAACLLAVVGLRFRGALARVDAPRVSAEPTQTLAVSSSPDASHDADGMQPVFFARGPRAATGISSVFANSDLAPQSEQLNWIGDIHLAPVVFSSSPDFLLTAKPDLKAAGLSDSQDGRDAVQPVEMTAFRFQR
jgi:anti-sigma factor RsiW